MAESSDTYMQTGHQYFLSTFYACRTRPILRIIHFLRNMEHQSNPPICNNSHSIHRLCPTMRTDIILRGNSYYQSSLSNPIHWHKSSRMNLRGILSRQSHSHLILRLPLHPPIYHCSSCHSPPTLPPRNRVQQPHRDSIRRRQNPISPLLHH